MIDNELLTRILFLFGCTLSLVHKTATDEQGAALALKDKDESQLTEDEKIAIQGKPIKLDNIIIRSNSHNVQHMR